MTFEKKMKINKFKLTEECEKLAQDTYVCGKKHADAVGEKARSDKMLSFVKDEAKEIEKEEYSRLDIDIRTNFKDYGFETKPAEGLVKATILTHESYKDVRKEQKERILNAIKEYAEGCQDEAAYKNAMLSFNDKKKSIENLRELLITGFYSIPNDKPKEIKKIRRTKKNKV